MDQYCFRLLLYKYCLFFLIYLSYLLIIDWWIFILHFVIIRTASFTLFLKVFQLWSLEALSVDSVSLWHSPTLWSLFIVLYFLASQNAPGLSCIFPTLLLESIFSAVSFGSFIENDIRNQELDASCAYCYWTVFAATLIKHFNSKFLWAWTSILNSIFKYW